MPEKWFITMRSVIVTGGSRGLGLAVVRHLAAEGYRVLAIARSMNPEFASMIKQSRGALHFVPFDLGEIEKVPQLVKQLHKEFGPIHGLVNNAAIGTNGTLAMMHTSQIEGLIRLNTLSPIVLSKYVVRHMMADGGGRIVNVASIAAFTGYSGLSVYAATKSSMIGFTRSLAREVGRVGVNVNAVAPGFIDTGMTQSIESGHRETLANRSALRRFACVQDVADAIGYLLGDKARNITGTVLTVDAGATA
jgi:3-oxoacyl-[acyl-carrier protein] reductase